MLIFISIAVIIIAIISLSIKYFISYAKLANYKSFDKAAAKEVKMRQHNDPRISCDYCGAVINTSTDRVCPRCGADYEKDPEWIARHAIDSEWVDDKAESNAEKEINLAKANAHKTVIKIKVLIVILILLLGSLVTLGIVGSLISKEREFARTEKLNDNSYQNFVPVDYEIEGDGIIIDNSGVVVKLVGIYQDGTSFKFGYEITNNSSSNMRVRVRMVAINNCAYGYNYLYRKIKAGSSATVYERAYHYELGDIGSMTFTGRQLVDYDYNTLYDSSEYISINTSATDIPDTPITGSDIAFKNDYITIYKLGEGEGDDKGRYGMEIVNNSEYNFTVSLDSGKYNDKELNLLGYPADCLPAGCVCSNFDLYSHDDEYLNKQKSDKVYVTFTFKCPEHPEVNFSTGFFDITQN